MRIAKYALIGLAAGALAVAFSGCVVFQGPIKAKQVGHSDKIKVRFKLCNSDDQPGSTCPDFGNSEDSGMINGEATDERVLLGFRVPKGTKLPKTISPRGDEVQGEFTRFPLYKELLNQEAPKGRRYKWLGYESSRVVDNTMGTGPGADPWRYDDARFKLKLKLPRGFDAKRFKFRPVVGWFLPGDPPDPALVCGPALYDYVDDADGTRVCIDSPSPETVGKSIKVPIDR
jgi:hypothetical protein